MTFNPAFLERHYSKPRIPRHFKTFTDAWLWWRFAGQGISDDEMHRAYPGWFGPTLNVLDSGPLDATEP